MYVCIMTLSYQLHAGSVTSQTLPMCPSQHCIFFHGLLTQMSVTVWVMRVLLSEGLRQALEAWVPFSGALVILTFSVGGALTNPPPFSLGDLYQWSKALPCPPSKSLHVEYGVWGFLQCLCCSMNRSFLRISPDLPVRIWWGSQSETAGEESSRLPSSCLWAVGAPYSHWATPAFNSQILVESYHRGCTWHHSPRWWVWLYPPLPVPIPIYGLFLFIFG